MTSSPWATTYQRLIKEVEIENGVTSIGSYAFYNCKSLTSITIPNSVKSIDETAFRNCSSLEKFTVGEDNKYFSCDERGVLYNKDKTVICNFPVACSLNEYEILNTVKTIRNYAFEGATRLSSITIPASVTSIGANSFDGCAIAIKGETNSTADSYAKTNLIPFVGTEENWTPKVYYNGKCGTNLMWQLYQNGNLKISYMNGVTSDTMTDYSSSVNAPWYSYRKLVRTLDVPKGIENIGAYALYGCEKLRIIYFSGTKAEWLNVLISDGNEPIYNAAVECVSKLLNVVAYEELRKEIGKVDGEDIPVIVGISELETAGGLKANLIHSDDTYVMILDHDGNEIEDDALLLTGYTLLHLNASDIVIEEILLAVDGDVNNDGLVTMADVELVGGYLAGNNAKISKVAVDKNLDDEVSLKELRDFVVDFIKK